MKVQLQRLVLHCHAQRVARLRGPTGMRNQRGAFLDDYFQRTTTGKGPLCRFALTRALATHCPNCDTPPGPHNTFSSLLCTAIHTAHSTFLRLRWVVQQLRLCATHEHSSPSALPDYSFHHLTPPSAMTPHGTSAHLLPFLLIHVSPPRSSVCFPMVLAHPIWHPNKCTSCCQTP